ncbi:MAG: hypothetical protein HKN82_19375, partial [Akkermansiaceae bacterium]|nr:hypothetical protein [Akkermansiaceae bacterium]
MNEQLPRSIKKRLQALLRRVRRLQLARGIMGVVTVALGGVLAVMAIDFFLAPVPAIARWAMFVLLVAGLGVAAYTWLWKPLVHRISLVQVARWIETRHPEIEERISTAVELSGSEGGVSEELLHELIMAAEGDVEAVDPEVEVRSRRAKRWMYPAAGLAAVLAVLFVIWPGETGRLLVRAVAPFSDVGNAGAVWFEIDPGDMEVMEGDEVKITIKYDGPRAEALTLVVGREGAEAVEETLAVARVEDGKREFHYRLPLARESFIYHARVRKAQSDQHRVTVYPLPRLEAVTVDYQYPGYTGRAPHERQLGRAVEALAGTEVRLQGVPNTPVESGKFLIDGKEFGAVKIEAGAGGGRAEVAWRLMPGESGLGQVMVTHRLGREVEALRFPVNVRLDEPPKVEVVAPVQRDLRVRPDELITIEYEVEEDVDLAAVAIEMRVNGKSVPSLPEVLPERDHSDKRKLWRGEALVYVGSLLDDFEKAREVKMRLAVTDVLPADLDGPGVGYSEWLTIRIDRNADSLVRQEIRAQQSDARETIEEAMRDVTEAKQKMDANRHFVKKEELPKHAEKQFAEAREKLAAAEAALDKLAERMEHGVQAAKADAVREAADSAKEAREHLENTPLQDTPEGREAELDEGRQAAQEAMEALQELRNEVNRDEQKLQELARLGELAQQEREVARQAERRAEQEGAETPADPQLQQQQRQIQQQLEQQMRQNPEAAAEMLERQAERARELAERAEELSARQEGLAQEMEQRAQDAPRPEPGQEAAAEARAAEAEQRLAEALQEQLQQEQENIVREAQARMAEARQNREERADLLPEAIGEAQEALEAMKKSEPQAAAEAAQAAAEKMENLAKSSEERAAKPEADGGEGEMAQESSGEKPGQEGGEPAAGESGEKPDAGGEGEMAQESSGEKPGQEGGEPAAGESGEKPD